jgi:SPP1 gp7 family putative phage head morphogenesis protein
VHNVDQLAERWVSHDPVRKKSAETDSIVEWIRVNASIDPKPLEAALRLVYGDGYVLGADIAKELLTGEVLTDWNSWTAGNRAASLLVDQPNGLRGLLARSSVTIADMNTTTLNQLGSTLARSLDAGHNAQQTAKAIRDDLANPSRALMIAVTETRRAVSASSMDQYKEAGVEQVEWLTADPCDVCSQNEAESPIDLGSTFSSDDQYPPAHPNCRCAIAPVVSSQLTGPLADYLSGD